MTVTSSKDRTRRELTAGWRHVDWVLVATVVALACVGVAVITSATLGVTAGSHFSAHQAAFLGVGAVVVVFTCMFDYSVLRRWSWACYGATVFMLVVVMSPLGQRSKGAQAWFGFGVFQLQPAEFAKVALVIVLADLLARWDGDLSLGRIALLLGVVAVPAVLVVAQPDLGMMLAFVVLVVGMLAVGGARADSCCCWSRVRP